MSRLVDAERLTKDILGLQDCYNGFSDTYDKECIIGVIDEQPTIDAVSVVRCKDCIQYDLAKNGLNGHCTRQYAVFTAYDFCSYGKRKGGDAE